MSPKKHAGETKEASNACSEGIHYLYNFIHVGIYLGVSIPGPAEGCSGSNGLS